jgi:nitroreductase
MQFYDVINNRKSIKNFTATELDREKLTRMLESAMRAPSWKNTTPYKFILVDKDNIKSSLAGAILNKNSEAAGAVQNAPMTAAIVADASQSGEMEGKDYYLVDSAIAMEHFILAATEEGYGTCWIASFDEKRVKEILSIPDNLRVVALTPIGKAQVGEEEKPHHPKKDMHDFVYVNKWNESFMDQNVRVLIHQ